MDRPYTFINVAMTADGKIDTFARKGAAISSAKDKRRVDELRAGADAILLVGGWVGGKTFTETPQDDLEFMLNQHVRTTFNLFKAFEEPLSKNGWGRVILVSASTVPNPPGRSGVYAAAKSAQENMALSLAAELKNANVTANIIQVKAIDVKNDGKGTSPAEIVSAMQYLFSEEAGKITGARIPLY